MSVRQSFLFNILFTLSINFIIKPIWVFGIDRTVQNQVGSESYGMYFAIFNYSYIFQILLDFGLQNYNQTEIASDNSRFRKLLPGMLSAKLILTSLYLILTISVGYTLGYASHSFFPWLLLNQILLSFNVFMRSNISAHRLFIKDAFLSVLDKFLMILGCSFMLVPAIQVIPLSIDYFVWIQTIALSVTSVFCIYFNLKLSSSFDWKFDYALFKKIVLQATPFAVIYFLMTISHRIDSVMLERLLGDRGALEAGYYAQSYRIMESVNNIGYIVAGVLLPLFAFRLGQKEQMFQILKQGYLLMLTIIVPVVTAGVFFAKDIIHTLYPNEDPTYSSQIFILLILNFIPVGLQHVLGPLLTARRLFIVLIPCLAIGTVINVTLNYFLIPDYGAYGAAITTLGTQCFVILAYWLVIIFLFKLKIDQKSVLPTLAYIFIAIVLNYSLKMSGIFWMYAIVITGAGCLITALFLKIISKETLELKVR